MNKKKKSIQETQNRIRRKLLMKQKRKIYIKWTWDWVKNEEEEGIKGTKWMEDKGEEEEEWEVNIMRVSVKGEERA